MSEIKAVSFRVDEDDAIKFRKFTEENGLNQAEMFESIIKTFEMARAKGQITDRAKEVETFQTTVNTLLSMFINSLAINQTSEERIRETLSLELSTKDKTISDLQQQREKLKEDLSKNTEGFKTTQEQLKIANGEVLKLTKELEQKSNIVNSQQEQINTLNSIVTEYKEYKDINIKLEEENIQLSKVNAELNNVNLNLSSKLENTENMKEFYKGEVDSLKAEIKTLNNNIKVLENEHKEEITKINEDLSSKHREEIKVLNDNIKALESEHKKELEKIREELESKYKEALKVKVDFEKEKMLLEVDKANSKAQLIQDKYNNLEIQFNAINEKVNATKASKTKKTE